MFAHGIGRHYLRGSACGSGIAECEPLEPHGSAHSTAIKKF